MHNIDSEIFDNRLLFYGLHEFVEHRRMIKKVFRTKNRKEQYLYKLFIYSQPFISDTWKNNIWDFLQDDTEVGEFERIYQLAYGNINKKV